MPSKSMNSEKTALDTLTRADKFSIGGVAVIACFTAGLGAFSGQLWMMVAGIMLAPIAFIIRFPRRARSHDS